ncbi:MAG: CoA-binding protein [Dehalococcoidia bacterium]|nr:CoA-binding protein [Dehalococcoidia bacterium]
MNVVEQLRLFVEPKSIAAIGVSRQTGPQAYNLLENLLSYGYEGRVYPVNPNASEILGLKTYSSVRDVPEVADLALISLPRNLVVRVVRECLDRGIKAIAIITQGFADADDEEGPRLQQQIVSMARLTGARILGPNTFGVANARLKMSTSYIRIPMDVNGVATVSQTGGTFVGLNDIRLVGKAVDIGDACDVDAVDCLEYFEQDADTRVVILHVEGMPDAKRFLAAARRVSLRKPVLAIKTGRSAQSARAVQSHTGALTGSDVLWDVALRDAGVIRVNDIEELSDAARAFLTLAPPRGNRIGVTTYTGGFGIIAADACGRYGMDLAEFSASTMAELERLSPEWLGVGNPVDIWPGVSIMGHSRREMETAVLRQVMSDPGVDAAMAVISAYEPRLGEEHLPMIREVARDFPDKPFVYFMYGKHFEAVRNTLESTGTTLAFPSPERAVRALMHLKRRADFLARHELR